MAWFGKKEKKTEKAENKEEKPKKKTAAAKKPSLVSRITSSAKKKVTKKKSNLENLPKIKKSSIPVASETGFVDIAKSESEPAKFSEARRKKQAQPAQPEQVAFGQENKHKEKFWRRLDHLPEHYGDNFIYLLVRDPYWLYTYWEIQKDHQERCLAQIGGSWDGVRSVLRIYDVTNNKGLPSFFDIFLQGMASNWYLEVQPNRSYLVEIGLLHRDGRFVALARSNQITTPRAGMSDVLDEEWMDIDFDKIYALSGGFDVGKSSAELRKLMEERLKGAISSGSGAGVITSLGSPVRIAKKRGFWFVLDCELIVYGATEPDATVTLQGKPVKLRPDGTFTLRFAYPDGKQVLDAHAYSADGVEERIITPIVERVTERPAPVLKA